MARKADKLRPYRVDYFDIPEMKADRALVHSTTVRAVTAQAARDQVLHGIGEDAPPTPGVLGRIIIRSYRYYKNVSTKEVYKPIEDLFSTNKAIEVMEVVEKFRTTLLIDEQFKAAAGKMPADPLADSACPCPCHTGGAIHCFPCNCKALIAAKHADECDHGNATNAPIDTCNHGEPPCGTAEIASRNNYVDPDKPTGVINLPDLPHFDLDSAAPIIHPAPTAVVVEDYKFPDYPVVPKQPAVFDGDLMPGTPDFRNIVPANEPFLGPTPLWLKLVAFGSIALFVVSIVLLVVLHSTH